MWKACKLKLTGLIVIPYLVWILYFPWFYNVESLQTKVDWVNCNTCIGYYINLPVWIMCFTWFHNVENLITTEDMKIIKTMSG